MTFKSLFFALAIASTLRAASPSADSEIRKQTVAGINGIIDEIQAPYAKNELASKFHVFGDDISKAKVIFLGENHFHETSHLDQMRALQFLLDPKTDVVLLEGGQAGTDGFCNQIVLRHYLLKLLLQLNDHLKKNSEPTVPFSDEALQLLFKQYEPTFGALYPKFRINEPKVMNCKCLYWDDDNALGLDSFAEGLVARHETMVREIKKHTSKGRRVFVIAGLAHLPNGDLLNFKDAFASPEEMSLWLPKDNLEIFKNERPLPQEMSSWYGLSRHEVENLNLQDFYSMLESLWSFGAAGQNRAAAGYGSSKVIFDFLKKEKLSHTELIPKALIQPLRAGDTAGHCKQPREGYTDLDCSDNTEL